MRIKAIKFTTSVFILCALPAFFVFAAEGSLVSHSKPGQLSQASCNTMLMDLGRGQKALMEASPELKAKLVKNWQPFLVDFNQSWSLKAFDILKVIFMDQPDGQEELKSFVKDSLENFFKKAPIRQTEGLLSSPVSNAPLALPSSGSPEIRDKDTSFTDQYRLMDYAQVSWRVFDEILPPDYLARGHFSASFSRGFSTFALPVMFQIADELGLHAEAGMILQLMLVHEKYDYIVAIAEKNKNDKLIYRVGLYALSKFYFDRTHPFYYNKLWYAIEALKRVRDPQVRSEVRTLMIELSKDIASDHFYDKIKKIYPEDAKGAASHMSVLIQNILRGLQSSGDIIQVSMEDSVKQDFITYSNDPELKQTVRDVIEFAKVKDLELTKPMYIEALQATGDKDSLVGMANEYLKEANLLKASQFFLAAGDVNQAVNLFMDETKEKKDPFLFKSHFRWMYETAIRANKLDEFKTAMLERNSKLDLMFMDQERKSARDIVPLVIKRTRVNLVDAEFDLRLSFFRRDEGHDKTGYQSYIDSGEQLEKAGDNLNAGGSYLIAAFYDALIKILNEE